ncbi:superoxide dismutase family protein [Algicola sagamiensis]|uniref:superoxide dismutase family protein n=1 Tax=Algicola sagamiensis TaxID=163869 RepID=UPI0003A52342|nr:superoxide dismutase family protein [Algicola sagamiensis]
MKKLLLATTLLLPLSAFAQKTINMELLGKDGNKSIGQVKVSKSKFGLVFTPDLKMLPPGVHGFHVHTNPSCAPKDKKGKSVLGLSAGGHYDPEKTGKHGFPWTDSNHKGDLPALFVQQDGTATTPVLAPRLTMKDLDSRSLMVHMHGDNHSDMPKKLGGGGPRIACGVSK